MLVNNFVNAKVLPFVGYHSTYFVKEMLILSHSQVNKQSKTTHYIDYKIFRYKKELNGNPKMRQYW